MQDGELIYRFRKILDLMRDVGRRFLSDGWKEFELISPLFVQRFDYIYPNECTIIRNYTKEILSSKKYNSNDLRVIRDAMDVIVDGYEDKERKLHPPKPNKVFTWELKVLNKKITLSHKSMVSLSYQYLRKE